MIKYQKVKKKLCVQINVLAIPIIIQLIRVQLPYIGTAHLDDKCPIWTHVSVSCPKHKSRFLLINIKQSSPLYY